LRFERRSANGADTHGVFHLTVPSDRTQPGEPSLLTVRGKGGSMRWFGLHGYTDVVEWATGLR
jgi:hypothetical protein